MAYPRNCPLCDADYHAALRRRTGVGIVSELHHTTLHAASGGTPSDRDPGRPGLLLALRCLTCRGEYRWDYFAGEPAAAKRRAG